jgi:hypothetical protein
MPDPVKSPAKQLAEFIDRFDPAIAKLARACRVELRKQLPTATEIVYDNYNALAIGFASSDKQADWMVSLAIFPRNVALSFYRGTSLPDPGNVLSGGGKQNRYIRLESPSTLARADVKALVRAAAALVERPLPTTGRGKTVIKSISAKQRPRRPS